MKWVRMGSIALYAGTAACAIALYAAQSPSTEVKGLRLHFAPNHNFDSKGAYLPGKAGFNLADVSSAKQLGALPAGVKGLAWVGRCDGADPAFRGTVRAYAGHPKLWGFYLMDDPDPRAFGDCAADHLRAEADWIHENLPGANTFIVLMNLGSSQEPSFAGSYDPSNSHVDLFGLAPYPCRSDLGRCDLDMIDRYVAAAEAAGISRNRIVPVYQAFGGGEWLNDAGGRYLLPTVAQEEQILTRWQTLVQTPVFDYAYSWGSQRKDVALESAVALQTVFMRHNNAY